MFACKFSPDAIPVVGPVSAGEAALQTTNMR
jgi:hypothetical protein